MAKNCGTCAYWDHANKRNCSLPEEPAYYAECLYPVNFSSLPECVIADEMSAVSGASCACYKEKAND